jgi:hypothetical protein
VPVEQTWPCGQTLPQLPQLLGSSFSSTHLLLQTLRPAWQVAVHVPLTHLLPAAQAVSQVPQLATSVSRLVQTPLQLKRPVWHETAHVPAEQTWPAGHTLPQLPQLFRSFARLVHSAPVPASALQASGVAAGQEQALPLHCWPAGHTLPQPPQFCESWVVSAQYVGEAAGHAVWVPTQLTAQPPEVQSCPDGQTLSQEPQLAGSFWVLVQKAPPPLPQAFGVAPGQEHAALEQVCPAAHVVPAVPASATPQPAVAPQNVLFELGSMQFPLQSIWGAWQVSWQEPPEHTSPAAQVVPAVPASATPQPAVAPQYVLFVLGSMQDPLQLI